MVFRCPTCGRFVKTQLQEGDSHFGTCKKCNINYLARYSGCVQVSGEYEMYLTVFPAPSNPDKGKSARYVLNE